MKCITGPMIEKEKIYNEYLKEIGGIKFTSREVDAISCILHNRKEKKIAELLSIAPKTVSTHIYNVMLKLGFNSREFIIDFVETSGKLPHFRQYYFCLTIQNLVKQYLAKISNILGCEGKQFIFAYKNDVHIDELLNKLINYLKIANIKIASDSSVETSKLQNKKPPYTFYVFTKESDLFDPTNKLDKDNYVLLLFQEADALKFGSTKYADFTKEDFYLSLFKLINVLINNKTSTETVKEFTEKYLHMQKSWKEAFFNKHDINLSLPPTKKKSYTSLLMLIILGISIASVIFFYKEYTLTSDIDQINSDFAKYTPLFSSDNVSSEEKKRGNYKIVQQLEQSLKLFQKKSVQEFFVSKSLTQKQLLNYLYIAQCLSSHYMYNQHNYLKAQVLLINAKNISQSYIENINNLKINFNALGNNELYAELNVVKGLPEIYTRIIYLLGRTFVLGNVNEENLKEARKCFEISHYIGDKLGTFEAFLSIGSGFELIKDFEIEENILNKKYVLARRLLNESIEITKKQLEDERAYKANYRPENDQHIIIVPKNSNYNKVRAIGKLLRQYNKLITITNDNKLNLIYAESVLNLFFGNKTNTGVFKFEQEVVPEILASNYNALCKILLTLNDKHIPLVNFKNRLTDALKIDVSRNDDLLDIIEYMYNVSLAKSRVTNYAKADAYQGLARIFEKRLEQPNLDIKQEEQIKTQIELYQEKSDTINKDLNRKEWQRH